MLPEFQCMLLRFASSKKIEVGIKKKITTPSKRRRNSLSESKKFDAIDVGLY